MGLCKPADAARPLTKSEPVLCNLGTTGIKGSGPPLCVLVAERTQTQRAGGAKEQRV